MASGETASNGPAAVLAGPILRRVTPDRLVLWLVLSADIRLELALYRGDDGRRQTADHVLALDAAGRRVRLGDRAWVVLIDVVLADYDLPPLPEDVAIGYDLRLGAAGESLAAREPGLCYAGEARPRFVVRRRLDQLLHGSCRRPHNPSLDGMARADRWLARRRARSQDWPPVLLLTGDQIYADDVAAPLLRAIHALIADLGLWPERLTGAYVADSAELYASDDCYYRRDRLLPKDKSSVYLSERFFGGKRKPVFSSATADNHLITLAEVVGMYLLCFSDAAWRGLKVVPPALSAEQRARYETEDEQIRRFVAQLPAARRIMANTPTLMIFDDHDVTDDWNLSASWEDAAYGHPFSRRIIGNALIGYLLCQGLGNDPDAFASEIWQRVDAYAENRGETAQAALIDALLGYRRWYFTLPSQPPLLVMDTRMRRWRRERAPSWPSGLMDWEALTRFQQSLIGHDSAVIVSAAPIFGVKLIENMQRLFTWLGKPLMVDAENWMAHPGAAFAMLSILADARTPANLTVLSGDVHYSFCYDVRVRLTRRRHHIWQVTSSGVKNEFPAHLLKWFDRLNRWLYGPYSPLNWLTKRRWLRIRPRRGGDKRHLFNNAGVGYVRFNGEGQPVDVRQLGADDRDRRFVRAGRRRFAKTTGARGKPKPVRK